MERQQLHFKVALAEQESHLARVDFLRPSNCSRLIAAV
jgi:hypothetical protein